MLAEPKIRLILLLIYVFIQQAYWKGRVSHFLEQLGVKSLAEGHKGESAEPGI